MGCAVAGAVPGLLRGLLLLQRLLADSKHCMIGPPRPCRRCSSGRRLSVMGSWRPLSLCETKMPRGRRSLATLTTATGKLIHISCPHLGRAQTACRVATASCCCHSDVGCYDWKASSHGQQPIVAASPLHHFSNIQCQICCFVAQSQNGCGIFTWYMSALSSSIHPTHRYSVPAG